MINSRLMKPEVMQQSRAMADDDEREAAVARNLERLAWLMDRAIKIPGTKFTVGLDALFGLLPVGGDVLTGIVQAALVLIALRHYRVPKSVAARMMGNVALDVAVGSIPLLGDLFDVAFKANTRNIKLLVPYRPRPVIELVNSPNDPRTFSLETARRGTPWRYILPIAAILILLLTLVLIGFITVVRWMFR
jgi:Domain of unknown function (DUF4112)